MWRVQLRAEAFGWEPFSLQVPPGKPCSVGQSHSTSEVGVAL